MTNNALASGERFEITDWICDEIVSSLASSILKYTRPTPHQYTHVCNKLVQAYPFLEDTFGTAGSFKILRSMHACFILTHYMFVL